MGGGAICIGAWPSIGCCCFGWKDALGVNDVVDAFIFGVKSGAGFATPLAPTPLPPTENGLLCAAPVG